MGAGEIVGIVGPSGCGKSTLAKLIQRFYVPEGGRVLVDGVDLALVDTAWLRRKVGVVLQDNVLFNRSVRENIALTDPALPMVRVVHAAKLAGADEFIAELAQGYDTEIVEQGSNLSGGQRQRIAIACALIHRPTHPDIRRGNECPRFRIRSDNPAEHALHLQGPHGFHCRSSAVGRTHGQPYSGDQQRSGGRTRQPSPIARTGWLLRRDVPPSKCRDSASRVAPCTASRNLSFCPLRSK